MTAVSRTVPHTPPAPGAFSNPGSVGMLGKVETATFGGDELPVGGPNSATNGSTRPVPGTVLLLTIGTGVVVTGGGVDKSVVLVAPTGPSDCAAGCWLEHATSASTRAKTASVAALILYLRLAS